MKLDSIVVPPLLVLLLSCVLVLAACSTDGGAKSDQRYFTWVDEFGRVRQSPINEEKNPVEQRAAQVQSVKTTSAQSSAQEPPTTAASTPAPANHPPAEVRNPSHALAAEKTEAPVKADAKVAEPAVVEDQTAEPTRTALSQDKPEGAPSSASDPKAPAQTSAEVATNASNEDPAGRQSEAAPPQMEGRQAAEPTVKEQQPDTKASKVATEQAPNDASEYTLENYPDGNELAKKGFVREGDPLPYFTWRDAQGNVRVDYYRPEAGFDKPRLDRNAPALTSALVIDGSSQSMIEQANADALAVLGIDRTETLLDAWARQCCRGLPRKDLAEWDDSREFQLDLDDLAPEFSFSTGNSVYRLVELPEPEDSATFVMQVRSYVEQGVFLPTLAFLDKDMATRRLVTELAFEYQPESWHSHGYLEARVPVFPRQGDRWLLIMSRAEDQAGQTVFETEDGTTVIRHSGHGLLGLAQLGD